MALAEDWSPPARAEQRTDTKVKGGTVQSFESRTERRASLVKGRRLTEPEIAELQDYWIGYAAQMGFRSAHGAVEARLLRSPPSKQTNQRVIAALELCGGQCPETKLMRDIVESASNVLEVGLQRHEVKEAIRALSDRGILDRVPTHDPDGKRAGTDLRLRHRKSQRPRTAAPATDGPPMSARERMWAAQDHELWRMWNEIPVKDQGGKYREPPDHFGPPSLGRQVAAAIEAMSDEGALVLRAAYGTPPSAYGDAYGAGLGHVAAMTPAVRKARQEAAGEAALAAVERTPTLAKARLHSLEYRRVRPEDILRDRLHDVAFRAAVRSEAEAMLGRACSEYRKVRAGQ